MRMTHHTPDRPEESQSQQSEAHASVRSALDLHGYYLGAKIANRLTLLQGRMWDQNSCVIFVCKNVWTYLFGENAGRLQSNSQDNNILRGFEDNYKLFYLYLLSGIVRGTLASLGLAATVTPSIEEAYKFKISLKD